MFQAHVLRERRWNEGETEPVWKEKWLSEWFFFHSPVYRENKGLWVIFNDHRSAVCCPAPSKQSCLPKVKSATAAHGSDSASVTLVTDRSWRKWTVLTGGLPGILARSWQKPAQSGGWHGEVMDVLINEYWRINSTRLLIHHPLRQSSLTFKKSQNWSRIWHLWVRPALNHLVGDISERGKSQSWLFSLSPSWR